MVVVVMVVVVQTGKSVILKGKHKPTNWYYLPYLMIVGSTVYMLIDAISGQRKHIIARNNPDP